MNESNTKYVLGLDLGIASIGVALLIKDKENQFKRIENLGVRLFSTLEDEKGNLENKVRREKRGLRRLRRRKSLRLQETRELFLNQLGIDYTQLPLQSFPNPYELKIKGLRHQLSKEELAIALYHYMKYRGFKSNRKVDDEKSDGVLLNQIKDVDSELKASGLTITEYLYNQYLNTSVSERRIHNVDESGSLFNKKDANKSIRNKDDRYLFSANRSMYLEEINAILDNQISLGVISDSFKKEYLNIFVRQRSFSMGPGKGSPYAAPEGQTLISKMIRSLCI
jgi:CRISPR-associated endonuclease Csn1